MNIWITMLGIGIITVLLRVSFMLLLGRIEMPRLLLRGLRFVPPAVLSAIILPEMLIRDNQLALSLTNPRLIAGVLAALVAWRTKNVLLTIALGMLTLWLLQALVPA